MDTSSCNPKVPFIKLEDEGQAAILNYNLPQQTAYNAVGYLGLDVDKNLFKESELRQTTSPTWEQLDQVKELNTEGVQLAIKNENTLIKNFKQVQSNIKLEQVKLEALSHQTLLTNIKTTANLNLTLLKAQVAEKQVADRAPFAVKAPTVNIADLVRGRLLDEELIAQKINKGYLPVAIKRFSKKDEIIYVPRPKIADPTISIVLHLKMVSFLGNYGAGQTIKSIHLLPGESTTISMRTYKHDETRREQSQNVLDSYSETSADELQNTVQSETQYTSGFSEEKVESKTGSWNAGGSIGINVGFLSIGGGGGGGGENTKSKNSTTAIQNMVGSLVSAVNHHVSSSDTQRQIEINTETSSTRISETEESIVRNIQNINKSRVLNFVFRQLLQEFISITYLDSVSIVYYNGFPESRRVAKLPDLDNMLEDVLKDAAAVKTVQNKIYRALCNIKDYQDTATGFIEKVNETMANCIDPTDPTDPTENFSYIRKIKELKQTAAGFTVPGIILDVTKRVVRTDSAVVDALLGQGEALDCYNQNLQQAAVKEAELSNIRMEQNTALEQEQWAQQKDQWELEKEKLAQAIRIINDLGDPRPQVESYKKVFSDCCDVPQSGCGCGCNHTAEEKI